MKGISGHYSRTSHVDNNRAKRVNSRRFDARAQKQQRRVARQNEERLAALAQNTVPVAELPILVVDPRRFALPNNMCKKELDAFILACVALVFQMMASSASQLEQPVNLEDSRGPFCGLI